MKSRLPLAFALGVSTLTACDEPRIRTDAGPAAPLDALLPDAPGLDAPFPSPLDAGALGVDAPSTVGLATGVTLEGLSIFQGVRVELARGGAIASSRNAAIVAGRGAVVRAYVSASSYPRTVQGELESREGGRLVATHAASATLARASDDGDATSVLAFELPASEVTPTASLTVRLVDARGESPGASHPARLPRDGSPFALGASARRLGRVADGAPRSPHGALPHRRAAHRRARGGAVVGRAHVERLGGLR
jgi:hypothetical protein